MVVVTLERATQRREHGGKAVNLAAARRAGLPVPPAFVLPAGLFRDARAAASAAGVKEDDRVAMAEWLAGARLSAPLTGQLDDACATIHAALGGPLIARSSATVEDMAETLLPGVLESREQILSVAALRDAVRAVWASLYREEAVAYLGHRGLRPAGVEVAVLVQREVAGLRATLWTRSEPGVAASDQGPAGGACELTLPSGESFLAGTASAALRELLERAASPPVDLEALGAVAETIVAGAADVELVFGVDRVWVVQVRLQPRSTMPLFDTSVLTAEERALRWCWDAAHNPDPLSAAQAGLVDLVDRRCAIGLRQRLFGQYLFVARDARSIARLPSEPAPDRLAVEYRARLLPALEARLVLLEAPPSSLAELLDRYVAFYALYAGELAAEVRRARQRLVERLERSVGREAEALAGTLLAGTPTATTRRDQLLFELGERIATGATAAEMPEILAPVLRAIGSLAPSWDVAVPPYAEQPAALFATARALAASDRSPDERIAETLRRTEATLADLLAPLSPEERAALDYAVAAARSAYEIAEEDDLLFARAQCAVRGTLRGLGQALAGRGQIAHSNDVFDLPLTLLTDAIEGRIDGAALRALVLEARARQTRALATPPPDAIEGGAALYQGGCLGARSSCVLRGYGFGERVRGFATHGIPAPGSRSVLVLPTVLPAHGSLLAAATAIVTDHGGVLGHGAAQAREYGLAGVVGTRHATRAIAEGAEVVVDGRSGRVYVLSPS